MSIFMHLYLSIYLCLFLKKKLKEGIILASGSLPDPHCPWDDHSAARCRKGWRWKTCLWIGECCLPDRGALSSIIIQSRSPISYSTAVCTKGHTSYPSFFVCFFFFSFHKKIIENYSLKKIKDNREFINADRDLSGPPFFMFKFNRQCVPSSAKYLWPQSGLEWENTDKIDH